MRNGRLGALDAVEREEPLRLHLPRWNDRNTLGIGENSLDGREDPVLKTRGFNHIDLPAARGVSPLRPFVADDAIPRVRFRREGRRKIEIAATARP